MSADGRQLMALLVAMAQRDDLRLVDIRARTTVPVERDAAARMLYTVVTSGDAVRSGSAGAYRYSLTLGGRRKVDSFCAAHNIRLDPPTHAVDDMPAREKRGKGPKDWSVITQRMDAAAGGMATIPKVYLRQLMRAALRSATKHHPEIADAIAYARKEAA